MSLETVLIALPILLLSIVVHEYAHARVAYWQGDSTAWQLGRMTLNPVVHIDPVGTILFPIVMILLHLPPLARAKPVPINSRNFRNFRRGDILVSLAGVTANFLMAIGFGIVLAILNRVVPAPVDSTLTVPLVLNNHGGVWGADQFAPLLFQPDSNSAARRLARVVALSSSPCGAAVSRSGKQGNIHHLWPIDAWPSEHCICSSHLVDQRDS